jgi:hypothetical protein
MWLWCDAAAASWVALAGIVSHLLALVFLILAIIFYDSALYVGHSYLIFLVSGLMATIAVITQFSTTVSAAFSPTTKRGWVRPAVACVFNVIALGLGCAALATLSWIVISNNGATLYIGLRQYQLTNSDGLVLVPSSACGVVRCVLMDVCVGCRFRAAERFHL